MDTFSDYMGQDKWWWFVPTHPCLKINYLEKLYTKAQYKQFLREEKVVEEEQWDHNKKHFINELRKANFEKRIFGVTAIVVFGVMYMCLFQKGPMAELRLASVQQ